MGGRAFVAVLAAFLVLVPGASALPGDPGFEPTSPADGATLPISADGIPVAFTCPVYRTYDAGGGFAVYGGATDYGVSFSSAPALGADGRLTNAVALGTGRQVPGTQDQCTSAMNAGGAQRPQETPGTYYWQVWRICTGCPLGYENGPVRKLTLGSTAKPTLKLPAKIYAGYPVIATVDGGGLPNGSAVTVERSAGGGWKKVGSDAVVSGGAEPTVTLPKGTQKLRVSAVAGSQTIVSAEITRKVLPAGGKVARLTTGAYKGTVGSGTQSAKFTVSGRSLKGFQAQVPMLCPGVTAGQLTTMIGTASVKTITIAPDGGFVGVATSGSDTAIRVRGKLVGAKLSGGRVELSVGSCTGNISFQVRRA
jgi:hypothetical protein